MWGCVSVDDGNISVLVGSTARLALRGFAHTLEFPLRIDSAFLCRDVMYDLAAEARCKLTSIMETQQDLKEPTLPDGVCKGLFLLMEQGSAVYALLRQAAVSREAGSSMG